MQTKVPKPDVSIVAGNLTVTTVQINKEEMLRVEYCGITEHNYRGKGQWHKTKTIVVLYPMEYLPYFTRLQREATSNWAQEQRQIIKNIEDSFYQSGR